MIVLSWRKNSMMKFDKIVLATSNQGKLKEFSSALKNSSVEFIPQSQFQVQDVDESGLTYIENAIIKARHACKISGLPAIGDDSGLEIDALNGAPGIYSARYSGEGANPAKNIQKLLHELKNVPDEKRTGLCITVLAFLEHENDPSPIICEGLWEVTVLQEPKGQHGFGYDPILFTSEFNCSLAELDTEIKNKISHRGKALDKLQKILSGSRSP